METSVRWQTKRSFEEAESAVRHLLACLEAEHDGEEAVRNVRKAVTDLQWAGRRLGIRD